eukprot:gene16141-7503_t
MTPFKMMYGREARRPIDINEDDKDVAGMELKIPTEDLVVKFTAKIEDLRSYNGKKHLGKEFSFTIQGEQRAKEAS